MLIAAGVKTEEELPHGRRTGLNVRRIQNLLAKDRKGLILNEYLHKQGSHFNKKTEPRLVTLTSNELSWYHNEQERLDRKPQGQIELEFIYTVVKSYQVHNDRPAFLISVTMYKDKKGNNVVDNRDIIFSAETDEIRDKWIIAIEYLKTKAIYDAYAAKNRNVGFNAMGDTNDLPKNHDNDRFNK